MSSLEDNARGDAMGNEPGNGRNSASTTPSRKRPRTTTFLSEDEAPPPNKRIHTPTEEEKEAILREKHLLYKRLLDTEKNPIHVTPSMFPFLPLGPQGISPVSPVYSYLQQQQQQLQASGASLLGTSETGPGSAHSSAILSISGLPTPGGSSVGSLTPPRSVYPSQMLAASFLKYPFSPPTPSSLSNLSLMSPWSNGNVAVPESSKPSSQRRPPEDSNTSSNPSSSNKSEDSQPKSAAPITTGLWSVPAQTTPSILGALSGSIPNQPCFLPGQSPLSYFQNSPMSPMMLLNSPYAQSLSSIPSVGSSSGCSSSSDGPPGSVASHNNSYAPSEYHVGPRRPLVERIVEELDNQSEDPSNSGRNTPIDVGMENNAGLSDEVDGALLAQRLAATASTSAENNASIQTPLNDPPPRGELPSHQQPSEPFSVESLSSSVNPQNYLGHLTDRPSSGVSSMSSSVSSRDSTPEPDDLKHHTSVGSDTFCLVPGRLSLLSSTQKYRVGVGEVRRRLSQPECLNASVLGGILRRAKSKNGGHMLRQRLESIGVSLPPGRRKATDLSLFTSLVEGEALHLAKDFHRLCDNYFPHNELAQIIASQHAGTPEAQHRISMVKATQLILKELQAMVNAVGGQSSISPHDPANPYPGLVNYSLLTHGFGNPAINACLSVTQTYLEDLLSYYEGSRPVQPNPRCRYSDDKMTGSLTSTSKQYSQVNTSSTSTIPSSEASVDGRNRSGLFVCLKQEPSD